MVKRTKRRASTKRKKHSKKTPKKSKRFILLLVLLLTLVPAGIGIYLAQKNKADVATKEAIINKKLMQKMKVMLENERKRLAEKKLPIVKETVKKEETSLVDFPPEPTVEIPSQQKTLTQQEPEKIAENGTKPTEVLDYEKSVKVTKKKTAPVQKKAVISGHPKLAIIIDDVSFVHQVKAIKAIPYKVTPSFLPPTKRHPDSHHLVRGFPFYMVHLPLEALHHNAPEVDTLKVSFGYQAIKQRIQKIKQQFPQAIYYNNHTGSKFTANRRSMDYLFQVMKEEGLIFVDSRTTANTKAGEIAKKYHLDLFSRDVFLDNSYDPATIRKQLKRAVYIAKKTGMAIAIGHPHRNTLTVLANAKNLLKGVELVYINEL